MTFDLHLLDGAFDPMTHELYLVQHPLGAVVSEYVSWQREIGYDVAQRSLRGDLDAMLRTRRGDERHRLFVQARGWTAIFGGDCRSPVGNISRRLGCQGLQVTYVEHTIDQPDGEYGARLFLLHRPQQEVEADRHRHVYAMNDGRWEWNEHGTPLPFEKPEHYTRRRIKDRLPPELLVEYCAALGARPWDEDFYGDEGVLVETSWT